MRLVLFEIDETLVWTQGATLAAVVAALHEVYGVSVKTARYSADGKTEPQMARDLLRRSGVGPELVDAGLERWAALLPRTLRAILPAHPVEACPGARALIQALHGRADVLLGLMTGSLESTAPIKLGAAGLDAEAFGVGAYGSDDSDRKQLPGLVVMRAEEILDRLIMHDEVVVVGATPAEIACARAYGARAVGVASGRFSAAELERYAPAHVLPDLSDTRRVTAVLLE